MNKKRQYAQALAVIETRDDGLFLINARDRCFVASRLLDAACTVL